MIRQSKILLSMVLLAASSFACSSPDHAEDLQDRPLPAKSAVSVLNVQPSVMDWLPLDPCEAAVELAGTIRQGVVEELLSTKLADGNLASWAQVRGESETFWLGFDGGLYEDIGQSSSVAFALYPGQQLVLFGADQGVDPRLDAVKPEAQQLGSFTKDGSLQLVYGTLNSADVADWLDLRATGAKEDGACTFSFAD